MTTGPQPWSAPGEVGTLAGSGWRRAGLFVCTDVLSNPHFYFFPFLP